MDKWQLLADALRALADVRRRQAELTRRIEAIRVMDGIGREVELARLEAEIDAEIDAQSTEITGWILLLESELTRDDREIH